MIRVLLVDDEYLALEDLKTIIDWESAGFQIIGTALSGKQALRLMDREHADLVITDISMPNMNGIDLIREIKKCYPDTLFLLLTAYEEVPYMKSAFALGVEDYLSKDEITSDFLTDKLLSIREKFYSMASLKKSYIQKKVQFFFNHSSEVCPEELQTAFSGKYSYCVVIPPLSVASLHPALECTDNCGTSTYMSLLHHCEAFDFTQDTRLKNVCTFYSYRQEIIMIIRVESLSSEYTLSQLMYHFSELLGNSIQTQLKQQATIIYSPYALAFSSLRQDYLHRRNNFKARLFLANNHVLKTNLSRLWLNDHPLTLNASDISRLYPDDFSLLMKKLDENYRQIVDEHNYTGFIEFADTCIYFLEQHSPECTAGIRSCQFSDFKELYHILTDSLLSLSEKKAAVCSPDTQKAVSYIHKHYGDDSLSIQEISEHVGLSATHLNRVFKHDMGITIWDYLTKHRIDKACEILAGTNAKIYQVAEMTGYSSAQYFSQVFYKYTSVKPLDYRRKYARNTEEKSI